FLNLGKVGDPVHQACSVESLVDEAVNLLRPKSRHTNIDLIWEKPELNNPITGNPDQLGQVFLNLIGNALDAAGPGGRVQIQVRARLCASKAGGSKFCRVEVIDSGPGPSAALADRIFEPFITGKPDGVGLGLALAKQVTEAHQGRIGWDR